MEGGPASPAGGAGANAGSAGTSTTRREGDPVWQVEPGTPFEALPPHWSCPNCAAEQSQFLVLDDD